MAISLTRFIKVAWRTLFTKPDEPEGQALRETVLTLRMEAIRFDECEAHGLPRSQCTVCWPIPE